MSSAGKGWITSTSLWNPQSSLYTDYASPFIENGVVNQIIIHTKYIAYIWFGTTRVLPKTNYHSAAQFIAPCQSDLLSPENSKQVLHLWRQWRIFPTRTRLKQTLGASSLLILDIWSKLLFIAQKIRVFWEKRVLWKHRRSIAVLWILKCFMNLTNFD